MHLLLATISVLSILIWELNLKKKTWMDDDIDDDEELILEYMVDRRKALVLFPAGIIVERSNYRSVLTHRE